ncbi:hypothetical protein P8452_08661 [Trifolium repens]|nr:hypothetical protein P8452_08661 [Trifolium repens]
MTRFRFIHSFLKRNHHACSVTNDSDKMAIIVLVFLRKRSQRGVNREVNRHRISFLSFANMGMFNYKRRARGT